MPIYVVENMSPMSTVVMDVKFHILTNNMNLKLQLSCFYKAGG